MDLEAAFDALPGLTERSAQPRLAAAFGTTSALAMGRGNYACLARMDALVGATRLAATATEEAALEVAAWAADSATGSRLDAPPGVRDDVWDLVSTSGEDCPGQKGCAFHHRCFAERARDPDGPGRARRRRRRQGGRAAHGLGPPPPGPVPGAGRRPPGRPDPARR